MSIPCWDREIELRFQRCRFFPFDMILGRRPRLAVNAAPLALHIPSFNRCAIALDEPDDKGQLSRYPT